MVAGARKIVVEWSAVMGRVLSFLRQTIRYNLVAHTC